MDLTINGTTRAVEDGCTLHELLEGEIGTTRGSAAAVDGAVIPRGEWSTFILAEGQSIELLTAVQGG